MNRSLHNTENTQPPRANKLPNYAQAARSSQPNNSSQQQRTRVTTSSSQLQQQTPQQQSDLAAGAGTTSTSDGITTPHPPHLRNTGSSGYHSNSQHSYSGQSYKNSYPFFYELTLLFVR